MISDNKKDGLFQRRLAFVDYIDPPNTERITEVIEDRLISLNTLKGHKAWISNEPTEDCFCDDANVLAAFVEQTVETSEDRERLLTHFCECDRCSYAVAELLRAINEPHSPEYTNTENDNNSTRALSNGHSEESIESGWIDYFEGIGLRPPGPTVFPDLSVADKAWEFGLLLTHQCREEAIETITKVSIEKLQNLRLSRSILLVAFSDIMHSISISIAAEMKELIGAELDIHVIGVKRFHEPCLLSKPSVVKNKSVVILTDVVHEGRLLHKLWDIVQCKEPLSIHALCLVNQQYNGPFADSLVSLGREEKEVRSRLGRLSQESRSIRFFDPVRGISHQNECPEQEVRWDPKAIEEWIPFIEKTEALQKNLQIGNSTYPFAINILTLLKDEQCQKQIAVRAIELFRKLRANDRWVFIYPASRGRRAGRIAKLLTESTGWQRTCLGKANNSSFMHINEESRRVLETAEGVIIVDAAIRTGDTLRSQVEVLRSSGITNVIAFYVMDLRRDRDRRVHEQSIGVPIHSLFRIPLGFGPTDSVKSALKRRFEQLEQDVESANVSSKARHALQSFFDKVLRQRKRAPNSVPQAKSVEPKKVAKELEKGAVAPSDLIEHVATGKRPNLKFTRFFSSSEALEDEDQARDARYSINNSASPGFIQELALLYTAHGDYSWLTKKWLVLHEEFLTNEDSAWEFLAGISFDARSKDAIASRNIRGAFEEFRESLRKRTKSERAELLFDLEESPPVYEERCETLIDILE